MAALDASIILGSQPIPQSQGPLEAYQKLLSLKNAQANQQQNAIALQSQQLGLQSQQLQFKKMQDAEAGNDATKQLFAQNAGKITDDQILATAGPEVGGKIIKARQDAEKSKAEISKYQAETQKLTSERAAHEADYAGHLAYSVKVANYDPRAVQLAIQQAHGDGFENQAQQLSLLAQQNPQALPQVIDQLIARSPAQQKRAQEEAKAAQEAKHQTATEEQAKATLEQTAKRDEGMNAYRQLEALISQKRLGIEQQNANTGAARLGLERARFKRDTVSPLEEMSSGQMEEIKAMANGDVKLPPAGSRAPGAAAKREAAFELARRNGYDLTDALYKAKQDFKVGKDSGEVAGMTRVLGHLDRYQQNSDKLGVAPSLAMNVTTAGNAPLHKDVSAISEEFGKLVKGGVLTVDQSKDFQSGLLSSRPAVRNATINEIKELMGSQFEAKFQKFKTATGTDLNPTQFFDAATQKRLIKQGLVPGQAGTEGGAKGKLADPLGIR
jgi:hypothetical protein